MIRTRFAPSPTGYLHIGGLRTALYAYLFAKKDGDENGQFILRIEDTDRERLVSDAAQIIYDTLKNAGLPYDEGPDVGGDYGPYIQSDRKEIYAEYAKKLVELGGAYYCFCTKERLESLTDENGQRKYDKHCLHLSREEVERRIAAGEPYVIRQNIPEEGVSWYEDLVYGKISVELKELEDNILIKSDGMPTYNFANVIDDHLMKINYVIRGTEYLSSTPKYNLLYEAFGWEIPKYLHLPPVMRDEKHKLSKRYGDPSYNDLLNEGFLGEALVNYIALLGWSPKENVEKMDMETLKRLFTLEGISHSPAIFDKTKLRWLNGEYIKAMSPEEFAERAKPWLDKSPAAGRFDYITVAKLLITRVDTFGDIAEKLAFLDAYDGFDLEMLENKKQKATKELAKEILPELIERVEALPAYTEEALHDLLIGYATEKGYKNGQVMWPFRIAITGAMNTPGGAIEMALLFGKEVTLCRLKETLARLA
ncbi:MAG: glutamate--tRNA ligase [Clostridia bacterium]|nr:glutamate--tRNA ligase [Clostridia bacterium]